MTSGAPKLSITDQQVIKPAPTNSTLSIMVEPKSPWSDCVSENLFRPSQTSLGYDRSSSLATRIPIDHRNQPVRRQPHRTVVQNCDKLQESY